jgi:hypothetical protein
MTVDAKIAAALSDIAQGQPLTTEDVILAAQDPNHMLHPYFEWDDAVGGERHRRWQARQLIRRVQIETPTGHKTRKYVSIKTGPSRQYEELRVVVEDKDKYEAALLDMARRLGDLEDRLKGLVEMGKASIRNETAQTLRDRVTRLRNQFETAAELPRI